MDLHTATEQAYKKGYAKGFEDGKRQAGKCERWIIHRSGTGKNLRVWAECPVCRVTGSPQWKCCPVCETKMDLEV